MFREEDRFCIRILPDVPAETDHQQWVRHGGKWIVFDNKNKTERLAGKLESYIDVGTISSAKYWKGDPSAVCVYSLDSEKEKTRKILDDLGAAKMRVWEYDYAWDKNFQSPLSFLFSQTSKLRTILKSYGCRGSWELLKEALTPEAVLLPEGKDKHKT